jgi:hypothetical protein
LAYIFDPIRNTFVDDEDTSLGNKLALNDEEFEKLLKIPGVFRASEASQPPPRQEVLDREAINRFIRDNKAQGGMIRQNFVAAGLALPVLSYPVSYGLATVLGISTAGLGAKELGDKVTDYIKENPQVLEDPRFKAAALAFGITPSGLVFGPDADQMEKTKKELEGLLKPGETKQVDTGPIKTGETKPLETEKQKPPVSGTIDIPPTTGGSEIPEQLSTIFESKKAPGESKKEYGKKALEDLNPETLIDIDTIIKDYRNLKTRPAGIYDGRFRKASTQPRFKEEDKVELIELVINKYKEKENKLPSATELQAFLPFINANSLASKYNIKLGQRKADFDRTDPEYIENVRKNKKLKANQNSTITNFAGENFFPDTIKLKDGSTVNAEKFFIDNLVKRTESGPSRTETLATTLKNKELAELFNTNIRKIEEVTKNIRKSPDFTADYPEPRPSNYGQKIALERIKKARQYLKPNELANVKLQEEHLKDVNDLFKDGTLVVTDFPNLVERLNTTMDKKTGKIDRTIKKTDEEMIERSKHNSGLFDVSHTIEKGEVEKGAQNIEFLRNRNFADYKTNQGFFKSAEAYVKNEKDDPEYDLRLEELDDYLKEIRQRVKIDGKFFGLDAAMIDSETGEFLGFNRQLEYYGLPKMENGVPLKKVKKASGGGVEITPLPRTNFGNGGATGMSSDEFVKELEYYFTNPDADLPKATTFRETMNPIEIFNDMIDPRNYPYIADRLAKTGIRIGEFGLRVLPAVGKLIGDITTKPSFKVQGKTGTGYIQDYDQMPKSAKIKGTGIFSEFLDNLVGTEMTEGISKATGLDDLIKMEEQKMMDRRTTVGPKVLADTATLGMEFTAPIFPGLKLLKAYAKARKLPVDNTTKELLEKEIKDTLDKNGISRRDFMKTAGAGASLVIAKMLGFGDEFTKATKVVRPTVEQTATGGVPPYFFELVKKIKKSGRALEPEFDPRVENNMQLGDYVMRENMSTGEISIQKTKEGMVDTGSDYLDGTISEETITYKPGEDVIGTDGKTYRTPDEYEEFTTRPDINDMGKMKDVEPGLDSIEEIIELMPNQLKRSELEAAGYNVEAFPDNIKQLLIDDLQKID